MGLSANAMTVLERRYLARDEHGRVVEDPPGMFRRVARAVAEAEAKFGASRAEVEAWAERFERRMTALEFLPNSPTLMNAGRELGQLAACFVVPVGDSMPEIFDAVKWASLIQMTGGGTGFSFSRLRPSGDLVSSTRGAASGPLAFMDVFNSATDAVKQGGTRRGANMGVLRVDHPDILAFIEAKLDRERLTNFNVSVAVTDAFMRALDAGASYALVNPRSGAEAGRLDAKVVWEKLARAAWATGDPGIIFVDRINERQPTPALGEIESTNPCVAGDTRVLVEHGGWRPIRELVGARPTVATADGEALAWRGAERVMCTGVRPVFRLITREGFELRLTAEHRVATDRGDVPAEELEPGDRVIVPAPPPATPSRDGRDARLGEVIGWLAGDGHFTWHSAGKPTAVLSFHGRDQLEATPRLAAAVAELVGERAPELCEVASRDLAYLRSQRLRARLAELGVGPDCKMRVPEHVWRGSAELQAGYLRGLFSADGSVQGSNDRGASVRLTSIGLELLRDVQLLLLGLGVRSVIYRERRAETVRKLPGPAGTPREYRCSAVHEIAIARGGLRAFADAVGFVVEDKRRRLADLVGGYRRGPYRDRAWATVDALVYEGEEEVFDLAEPATRHFVAGGMLVHNCGEQPLLPFESCVLGSIDLAKFVAADEAGGPRLDEARLSEAVHEATRFLDDVIEVTRYPLPQIEAITKMNRKIGLGVMGFADLLARLHVPYDAPRALELADAIGALLERESVAASRALARERGAFPAFAQSRWAARGDPPMRNATTTTVAPTGTISLIAGCSSGIEPIYALVHTRRALDGLELRESHAGFAEAARARGLDPDALWPKLAARGGRARGLEELPADLQADFPTAHDVAPEIHVRMQAVWQRHCHAAVSKTVNLPHDATWQDVARVYRLAWDLGCKGVTIYRDSSRSGQVLRG